MAKMKWASLKKKKETHRTGGQARNYLLAAAALIGVVALGFMLFGTKNVAAAPAWSATTVDGENISSDSFGGDVYVMDFFFLTCGICERQLPDNRAMVEALASRDDFHFVSITADPADTEPRIKEHQREVNATWAHVRDTYGLYKKFEVRGNPNLVFVDRQGNVALTVTQLATSSFLVDQAQRLLEGRAVTSLDPTAPTGP